MEKEDKTLIRWQLERCNLNAAWKCEWCFTFAGLAVWLQSEANRTAAADSCHWIMTCAITAAIVHCTGLCRETSTHSQTNPIEKYTADAVSAYLFLPFETAYMHTGVIVKIREPTTIFSTLFVSSRKQKWEAQQMLRSSVVDRNEEETRIENRVINAAAEWD